MFPPMHLDEEVDADGRRSSKAGQDYYLKPMNCPHHIQIYKARSRSYRDLPVRLAEFGTVYRYEQSGELHGPDPRARLHPGRRPPVRHARAGRGRS